MKGIKFFLLLLVFAACKTEKDPVVDCTLTEEEMLIIKDLRQTGENFIPISVMKQKIDSLYDSMLKSAINLEDDTMKVRIVESRTAFYKLLRMNASAYYRSYGNASGAEDFKEGFESAFLQRYYRELIFMEDQLRGSAEAYLEDREVK